MKADNGVQLRNEAADVRLIEQILDPLLESMLGIRFRKRKNGNHPSFTQFKSLATNKCRKFKPIRRKGRAARITYINLYLFVESVEIKVEIEVESSFRVRPEL